MIKEPTIEEYVERMRAEGAASREYPVPDWRTEHCRWREALADVLREMPDVSRPYDPDGRVAACRKVQEEEGLSFDASTSEPLCHGLPMLGPPNPGPAVACQTCSTKYGLRAIMRTSPGYEAAWDARLAAKEKKDGG